MKQTSLCYIENNGRYLMLHRNKKKNDENSGNWIGVGGKFLEGESPEECMIREAYEETGIRVLKWHYRGIVTFVSDRWEGEHMHLFTAESESADFHPCDEGDLQWIDKDEVTNLKIWEGDRIFLELLKDEDLPFFSLKLSYCGDSLEKAVLNGQELEVI